MVLKTWRNFCKATILSPSPHPARMDLAAGEMVEGFPASVAAASELEGGAGGEDLLDTGL